MWSRSEFQIWMTRLAKKWPSFLEETWCLLSFIMFCPEEMVTSFTSSDNNHGSKPRKQTDLWSARMNAYCSVCVPAVRFTTCFPTEQLLWVLHAILLPQAHALHMEPSIIYRSPCSTVADCYQIIKPIETRSDITDNRLSLHRRPHLHTIGICIRSQS